MTPDSALRPIRPIEQLEAEIVELAAHLAAGTCRWLLMLAEFDRRGGWAQWNILSCVHWLTHRGPDAAHRCRVPARRAFAPAAA